MGQPDPRTDQSLWRTILASTGTNLANHRLVESYAANLASRLPMIYCIVAFDILVLMIAYHGTAPAPLTTWLPLLFIAAVIGRSAYWLPANVENRTFAKLVRDMRALPWSGTVLSLVLTTWSLTLYGYGQPNQQALVHYITAVTCFTGILGLTQSPSTAVRMALTVMLPSSIVFLTHDHPNRFAIVAVQIVVSVLLVLITAGHHRDFVNLELSRQGLAKRERESAELAENNHLQATRDALTGAHNRRAILDLFRKTLADPDNCRPWLALVDLDGFKLINDTYGHAAGDAVLCAVSDRIAKIRDVAAFGRMGGDEFAILLPGHLTRDQALAALASVSEAVARPIPAQGHVLSVRTSIGVHKCGGEEQSGCLERADVALYKAKERRSGAVGEFTAADEEILNEKRAITRVFTSTNLDSQLALVYQSVVDSDTQRPVAFEALARWSPDGKTWLPPTDFITLAETTGRMSELTGLVLTKALSECRAWEHGCGLAINLSARDVLREDAAEWIGGIVAAAVAPPRAIVLEITESALLSDYRRAAANLEGLRRMGFRIALDDFGTGQSSLSHVHNLPLDHVKIDQSFARDIATNDRSRAIVGTIVALTRQLQLDCIIEGIETADQESIARALGLRTMQGYHFSRPISASEAIESISLAGFAAVSTGT